MRSEGNQTSNTMRRYAAAALFWLVAISGLHFWLNYDHDQRSIVRIGYMPVITNLAAPLLDHTSVIGDGYRFRALKFASFAEMAESLRGGAIDVAFMIAPLAIVLRQQGEDVKVVYIGNRHESTMVVRSSLGASSLTDLVGKTVAVPMRYSGHNLAIRKLLADNGLEGQISIVEMNPPDMAAALATGALDAYFVGEPFAAQTLRADQATLLFHVEDIWPGFICNLAVVRQDFIDRSPQAVQALVEGAARSGIWAAEHTEEAAAIASRYWNQPTELVEYALTHPSERIVFDRYTPVEDELSELAELMVRFGLAGDSDIDGLIDSRFADRVCLDGVTDVQSILDGARPPGD